MKNLFFLLYIFFSISLSIFSQEDIMQKREEMENSLKDTTGIVRIELYSKIAQLYLMDDPEKAITFAERGLEESQYYDKTDSLEATLHDCLGRAYLELKDDRKALRSFQDELDILESQPPSEHLMKVLYTVGTTYKSMGRNRKAIEYHERSLELATKFESDYVHNNRLELYENHYEKNDLEEAFKYYMLFMGQEYSEKIARMQDDYQEEQEQIQKELVDKSTQLEKKSTELQKTTTELKKKDTLIQQKDSMLMLKELQLYNARLDSSLKAAQIKELSYQQRLQEAKTETLNLEIKQQRYFLIGSITVLILILIFSFILFRQYRQIKKVNVLLRQQKEEIERQNSELHQQKEEIEAQRDEIQRQNEVVQKQNQHITESIQYASYLQNAILPPRDLFEKLLPDHFVLYKPKDIVSGDFYWLNERGNKIIIAAADCTGHGVPGAFMSMLGTSLLDEIVLKDGITTAGGILNRLRTNVKKSLRQTGKEGEAKDGMDISVCVYDKKLLKVQFAGAYNPVYVVKKTNGQSSEMAENQREIVKYNGDRMPIGIYAKETPFRNREIQLEKDDIVYMFSDGFPDQFGGEKNEKFKQKRFRELLLSNSAKNMEEQCEIIEQAFMEWKWNNDQIDDILVLGFRCG